MQDAPDPESRAIEAVERILLRDGFGALTMETIASEAGVSLATLYRRFGDRVGLLRAFGKRRSRRDDAATLAAAYLGQLVSLTVLFPGMGEVLPPHPELARTLVRTFLWGTLR